MFKNNRNLLIIALIAVVNALGYGIIIPILRTYSTQFGLSVFDNAMLLGIFSLFSFLSTPVIGRLSDKYGRKPLLVLSLGGTAISFFMMAFAPNAIILYLARALDGITAGNIPVASAVISDTTSEKDRVKGFGIIGASFGAGFALGPAISGLTYAISPAVPLCIAGGLALLATLATALFLPETNKHMGEVKAGKLYDFSGLFRALFDKRIGNTLAITFFHFIAFSFFIIGFQEGTQKTLGLDVPHIALLFMLFGGVQVLTQIFLVGRVSKRFGIKASLLSSLFVVAFSFFMMFATGSIIVFIISCILLGVANSLVQPLTQTILSLNTDAKSQGSMQGLNAAYMNVGQIIGTLGAGLIGQQFGITYPFLFGAVVEIACVLLAVQALRVSYRKESVL